MTFKMRPLRIQCSCGEHITEGFTTAGITSDFAFYLQADCPSCGRIVYTKTPFEDLVRESVALGCAPDDPFTENDRKLLHDMHISEGT